MKFSHSLGHEVFCLSSVWFVQDHRRSQAFGQVRSYSTLYHWGIWWAHHRCCCRWTAFGTLLERSRRRSHLHLNQDVRSRSSPYLYLHVLAKEINKDDVNARDDFKTRSRYLSEKYDWVGSINNERGWEILLTFFFRSRMSQKLVKSGALVLTELRKGFPISQRNRRLCHRWFSMDHQGRYFVRGEHAR
jgi:hypothetical protein